MEMKRARDEGNGFVSLGLSLAPRADLFIQLCTWGSRPRLYAVAGFAGWLVASEADSDCPRSSSNRKDLRIILPFQFEIFLKG